MNGKQSLVGYGGAGLILADFWIGGQRGTVAAGLFGSGDSASAHAALLKLGGEALLVVVLTILSGVSDSLGSVMAVVIVALWVLWAINHYGSSSPTKTQTGGT